MEQKITATKRDETGQSELVETASATIDECFEMARSVGLTMMQAQACEFLAGGAGVTEVAQALGVPRSSLYRWRENPAYQRYYNYLVNEIRKRSVARILSLQDKAFEALEDVVHWGNDRARLAAACWILDYTRKVNTEAYTIPVVDGLDNDG